jgi:hypothetical protein
LDLQEANEKATYRESEAKLSAAKAATERARLAFGERLVWLGLRIDAAANDEIRERINAVDSAVGVFVIPTDEELTIARHCIKGLKVWCSDCSWTESSVLPEENSARSG